MDKIRLVALAAVWLVVAASTIATALIFRPHSSPAVMVAAAMAFGAALATIAICDTRPHDEAKLGRRVDTHRAGEQR